VNEKLLENVICTPPPGVPGLAVGELRDVEQQMSELHGKSPLVYRINSNETAET
jgi:hypothetical protein